MERQELLTKLINAWTAICLHEGWGDVVGARQYWQLCTLDELRTEWQNTVDIWPEFV
jgi:hypothetical protein